MIHAYLDAAIEAAREAGQILLAEFARPSLRVVLAGARGAVVETTLGELLPLGFSRRHLS